MFNIIAIIELKEAQYLLTKSKLSFLTMTAPVV
jgi:hypothetical protein